MTEVYSEFTARARHVDILEEAGEYLELVAAKLLACSSKIRLIMRPV